MGVFQLFPMCDQYMLQTDQSTKTTGHNILAFLLSFWWWRTFKLLRWMQNLHQSMWDDTIFYSDRYLEYEQLLMRPRLQESKNINMASGWMVQFTFLFMERTHEPLHLVKWSFGHSNTYKYYLNHYFLWWSFLNMAVYWNYDVMLGQTLNYFV
jgi:hypothetical protein